MSYSSFSQTVTDSTKIVLTKPVAKLVIQDIVVGDQLKIQLKTIDDKGTFESDDEVGFCFQEIKQLGNDLENLFETEVEDAPIKEKKKKEK